MSEAQAPVLVHNRIAGNHRNTVLLLALVPFLLVPFAAGVAVWLAPWVMLYAISGGIPVAWFEKDPLWGELLLVLIAAGVVVTMMTVVILLAALLYRYVIFVRTDARLLPSGQEPDLRRLVENLCIGCGLPPPRLYLIESPVPNAFATGRDPAHAALGLTRGLLTLLTRRELEGVVAHELSHIGNHDSRLNTAVASVMATLRAPIAILSGIYRMLRAIHVGLGILFLLGFVIVFCVIVVGSVASVAMLGPEMARLPRWIFWRQVLVAVAPLFVLFGAPALGLFVRRAVSRQREYLADAEAVMLTQDPEGLALALTKIGAWQGPGRLRLGPSGAHLCIVDPLPGDAPWWDRLLPCHPPIQDRVRLLARMGPGIAESALRAAAEEGAHAGRLATARARPVQIERDPAQRPRIRVRAWTRAEPTPTRSPEAGLGPTIRRAIPVYAQPDGWSTVLCQLAEGAEVSICGMDGNFLKIRTADHVVGYISQSARGHLIATTGTQHA